MQTKSILKFLQIHVHKLSKYHTNHVFLQNRIHVYKLNKCCAGKAFQQNNPTLLSIKQSSCKIKS